MSNTWNPTTDHDLLIEINTKVGMLCSQLQTMEANKADRITVDEHTKSISTLFTQMDATRRLVYIGLGIVLAINAVAGIVVALKH
jgi:hypothetical protein